MMNYQSWNVLILVPLFLSGCGAGVQRFDEIMVGKVQKKAEFDFECGRKQLTVTKIDEGTYGVVGCGKRATYVGKDGQICWSGNTVENLENYCQVVPDTFAKSGQK